MIAGFITASGILIATSQLKHILGVSAHGHTLPEMLGSLFAHLGEINWITVLIGVSAAAFLFWVRGNLKPLLKRLGTGPLLTDFLAKGGPVVAVVGHHGCGLGLRAGRSWREDRGRCPAKPATPDHARPVVRSVERLAGPRHSDLDHWLRRKRVCRPDAGRQEAPAHRPDQELIGLGAANLGAAFTGGFPVTGGFSRSVVNYDAGAETPAAGIFTAARPCYRRYRPDTAGLFPAQRHTGRDHHRGRPVVGRFLDPEENMGLFPRRFHRRGRHDPA